MLTNMRGKRTIFERPTIKYLKTFILVHELGISESILLDEGMFDELALDYRANYHEPIPQPFVFLNVWIKIAASSTVGFNQALIVKGDPRPMQEPADSSSLDSSKIYRCGYCGILVDDCGNTLAGSQYELAVRKWKHFGENIFIATVCACCKKRHS